MKKLIFAAFIVFSASGAFAEELDIPLSVTGVVAPVEKANELLGHTTTHLRHLDDIRIRPSSSGYVYADFVAVFREDDKERHIKVNYNKDGFIEVITENNVLRIYPCGKVEKMTWTQVNPNEDKQMGLAGTLHTLPVTYYSTENNTLEWRSRRGREGVGDELPQDK